jgi:hypothetical protein
MELLYNFSVFNICDVKAFGVYLLNMSIQHAGHNIAIHKA